jgi:hypothetical protein
VALFFIDDQKNNMKIGAISFLFLLHTVTALQAKSYNTDLDSVAFAGIKRSLYFKVDKPFRGATMEIIDVDGKIVQKEVLTKATTIIYFDKLLPGSYLISIKKANNAAIFLYNNTYCLAGYIHLKKNEKIIDLNFLIPDYLKDEAEREAIVLVGKQMRESINLILAEDKLADIEVDVVTNHDFNLRTLSDTRIDENLLSYLRLVRAREQPAADEYVAEL